MKRALFVSFLVLQFVVFGSCKGEGSKIDRENSPGSLEFGGITRTYRLYIPSSYARNKPAPLLLVFHGLGGDGKGMEKGTRFNDLSDREGWIVVYPDGYKNSWADGSGVTPAGRAGIDDVGFVSALIDKIVGELKIDSNRVYAIGYSNGGLFVQRLACEIPNKIAAVVSVAGTMAERLSPRCHPSRAVSIMHIHGTGDSIVPWDGGEVRGVGITGWKILSVGQMLNKWAKINSCKKPFQEKQNMPRVIQKTFRDCRDGEEVVLYAVDGAGHSWPGVIEMKESTRSDAGDSEHGLYAEEVMWEFFEKHPMP